MPVELLALEIVSKFAGEAELALAAEDEVLVVGNLLRQLQEFYSLIFQTLVLECFICRAASHSGVFGAFEFAEGSVLLLRFWIRVRCRFFVRYGRKFPTVEVRWQLNTPLLPIEISLNDKRSSTKIF